MAIIYKCEQCGTNSWNEFPDVKALQMCPNVMKDGTICPRCSWDFELIDEKANVSQGLHNFNNVEVADADKVIEAELLLHENPTRARELLNSVAANEPTVYRNRVKSGDACLIKAWDKEDLLAYINAVREGIVPDEGQIIHAPCAYPIGRYYSAWLDVEEKEYSDAITQLRAGLRLEPDHPLLFIEMAMALWGLGKREEAIRWLDRAESERPFMSDETRGRIFRQRAVYLIDMGLLDEAEENLGESLMHDPDNKTTHLELEYIEHLKRGGTASQSATTNKPGSQSTRFSVSPGQLPRELDSDLLALERELIFTRRAAHEAFEDDNKPLLEERYNKYIELCIQVAGLRMLKRQSREEIESRLVELGLEKHEINGTMDIAQKVKNELETSARKKE